MRELLTNKDISTALKSHSDSLKNIVNEMTPDDYKPIMNEIKSLCIKIIVDNAEAGNEDFKVIKENITGENSKYLNKESQNLLWLQVIMPWLIAEKRVLLNIEDFINETRPIYQDKNGMPLDANGKLLECDPIYDENKVIKSFKFRKKPTKKQLEEWNKSGSIKPLIYLDESNSEIMIKSHFAKKARTLSRVCLALASFFEENEQKSSEKNNVIILSQQTKEVFEYIKKVGYVPIYDDATHKLNIGRKTYSNALKELRMHKYIPNAKK